MNMCEKTLVVYDKNSRFKNTNNKNYNGTLIKIICYTFRYLAVTFGGAAFDAEQLVVSERLKRFGYFSLFPALFITIGYNLVSAKYPQFEVVDASNVVAFCGYNVWVYSHCLLAVLNTIVLQRHGFKFITFIWKYHVGFKTLIIGLVFIASFYCEALFSTVRMHYSSFLKAEWTLRIVFNTLCQYIFNPLIHLTMIVIVITSLVGWRNLKRYRQQMMEAETTASNLYKYRQKFVELRREVAEIDSSFAPVIVLCVAGFILTIMLGVYMGVQTVSKFRDPPTLFFFLAATNAFKLVAMCIFSGYLHQESNKFVSQLDAIDIKDKDCRKEATFLVLVAKRETIGFYVAGFPLDKALMVSIFTFVLTYTILLIQTQPIKE